MNPADEIKELKEKRGALESQLLVVGISEQERVAIHQRIFGIDNSITELWKHVPPPPDERFFLRRGLDKMLDDPFVTGTGVLSTYGVGTWILARQYTMERHRTTPYAEKQLKWRRVVFRFDAPSTPNAVRVFAISAFLTLMRSWTNPPPSRKWSK